MNLSPAMLFRKLVPTLLFATTFGLIIGAPQWSLIGTGGGKCAVTGFESAVNGKGIGACPELMDKASESAQPAANDDLGAVRNTSPELKVDGIEERSLEAVAMGASLLAALILLASPAVFRGRAAVVLGMLVIAVMGWQFWLWTSAVDATNTRIANVHYLWEVSWWWCAELGLAILGFLFGLRMFSLRTEQNAELLQAWDGILRISRREPVEKLVRFDSSDLAEETVRSEPTVPAEEMVHPEATVRPVMKGRPWPVRPGLLVCGAILFLYAPMMQISCSGMQSLPQTGWQLTWTADSRDKSVPDPDRKESDGAVTKSRPMDGWTLGVKFLGWTVLAFGLVGGSLAGWRWWKMLPPSSTPAVGAGVALVAQWILVWAWVRDMNIRLEKDLFKLDGTIWWWATLAMFAFAASARAQIGRWPTRRISSGPASAADHVAGADE